MRLLPSSHILALVFAALVAGCSLFRPAPPAASTGKHAPQAAPSMLPESQPKVTLLAEQRRLADLFRGTPVVFEMQPDGSLKVGVPLKYSFDDGQVAVKPPLAAVLDRVAKSQRTQKTRLRVAAPADAKAVNPRLAKERAESTRDYLVAHGVNVTRFAGLAPASDGNVEIIVAEASQ
jgi:outer membrane protein OmpA-like peptidoglycan-associated protein